MLTFWHPEQNINGIYLNETYLVNSNIIWSGKTNALAALSYDATLVVTEALRDLSNQANIVNFDSAIELELKEVRKKIRDKIANGIVLNGATTGKIEFIDSDIKHSNPIFLKIEETDSGSLEFIPE